MPDIGAIWLKINYFGITHREDLKKWWVIILLAIDVFIVVFIFTNLIVYLVGLPKENKLIVAMAESPIDYRAVREKHTPWPLEIATTAAIPLANNKYDLVTKVKNNNKNWALESISYIFSVDGQETEIMTDFIMPNSEKYLTAQRVSGSGQGKASFTINEVNWKRVDDMNKLPVVDFSIDNLEYSSATATDDLTVHRVTAQVTNKAYNSFWQTKFIVVLYSADKIVGVTYVYLDQFNSGEKKSIYTQWNTVAGAVSSVTILPDINLLDQENIIGG